MWHDLLVALTLTLVIEGLVPFLSPQHFKKSLLKFSEMNDGSIRTIGLLSMVFGTMLLYLVNSYA